MPLSKAQAEDFRTHVRCLAMQIGLRAAARAYSLNEDRVRKWAHRFNWQISQFRPNAGKSVLSPDVPSPLGALANVMAGYADRTRLAMARTSQRAFEHCDTKSDEDLHDMPRAIALEKHARVASLAHNWNVNNVNVGVAVNVPLPTSEERSEMRSIDAKLDAIAAKLK